MDRKHKALVKLNVMTLFLIALSSISVTLAWFAYSGIAKISTEIDIKSWLIEFEKSDKTVSNNIVISLDEIYPGMTTVQETIKIKNKGDSNAKLSYSIQSARILDEEIDIKNIEQDDLRDKLSHYYPFSINMNLSDNFVLSQGKESEFSLSVSWPLDSDNDKYDSEWGNLAYQFEINEQKKYDEDPTYKIRQSIKIVIVAKAEQMNESEELDNTDINDSLESIILNEDIEQTNKTSEKSDIKYPLGQLILYDIVNNVRCEQLSETCIRTHIIDVDNKKSDNTVTLLADLLENYPSGTYENYENILKETVINWNVNYRELHINDILKIISRDINNSLIIRENLSDSIIGYVNSDERINNIINKTIPYNGYYSFINEKYSYLVTNKCYWLGTEYNDTKTFALTKKDEIVSKIYGEEKNNNCSVVPVIIASKTSLNI